MLKQAAHPVGQGLQVLVTEFLKNPSPQTVTIGGTMTQTFLILSNL